jgi:hypothetical protein
MRTFNIAKAAPGTLILLSDQLVAVPKEPARLLSGRLRSFCKKEFSFRRPILMAAYASLHIFRPSQ